MPSLADRNDKPGVYSGWAAEGFLRTGGTCSAITGAFALDDTIHLFADYRRWC